MDSWGELIKAFELGLITPDKDPEPIEHRLHYDETGKITMCSKQNHPENTTYVVVTEEEFNNYHLYYVKEGQLELIPLGAGYFTPPMQRKVYDKMSFPNNAGILNDYE